MRHKNQNGKGRNSEPQINEDESMQLRRPGHTTFLFSGQKKFAISGHFSGHQSHKNAFFCHFGRI